MIERFKSYFAKLERLPSAELNRSAEKLVVDREHEHRQAHGSLAEMSARKLALELGYKKLYERRRSAKTHQKPNLVQTRFRKTTSRPSPATSHPRFRSGCTRVQATSVNITRLTEDGVAHAPDCKLNMCDRLVSFTVMMSDF